MHSLACSQNKGLSKYQRRVSWLCIGPAPCPHPTGGSEQQSELEDKGLLQSWPETGILHQVVSRLPVANHIFLGSWMVDFLQEGHSLRSTPQRRQSTLRWCSRGAPGKQRPGPGRWLRCTAHLGQCAHQAPGHLAARTWEGHKTRTQPSLCTCRLPENLSGLGLGKASWRLNSVDPGSTHHLELGQTQCGPCTTSTPHTCQRYLFSGSLAPHNKTEQASLNRWPLSQGGK